MKINQTFLDPHHNRFYPHYGANSVRRNTNLYKNGKTKGKNKIPKIENKVKYSVGIKDNQRKINIIG